MEIDWPERFIYVASMTRGAAINAAPVAQAGIRRIAGIAVFKGLSGKPADEDNAHAPDYAFQRFLSLAAAGGGINVPPVVPYDGPADDISGWSRAAAEICAEAEKAGLPVIINLSGGTKPMAIGAMLGGLNRAKLLLVTSGLRSEILGLDGSRTRLAANGELTLAQSLAAHGYDETAVEEARAAKEFYAAERALISRISRVLQTDRGGCARLNGLKESFFDAGGSFNAKAEIDLKIKQRGTALKALERIGPLPSVSISAGVLRIAEARWARMLVGGGWLEAVLFNELSAASAGTAAEILPGVELRRQPPGAREPVTTGEIDVAVMHGSQLHIIEAKSAQGKKERGKWLPKLMSLRRHPSSEHALGMIVNPLLREDEPWMLSQLPRAKEAGIDILAGAGAIQRAVREIRALCSIPA